MENMRTLREIHLNNDWDYLFTANWRGSYADAFNDPTWIPLPDLTDWGVGAAPQAGADWFRHCISVDANAAANTRYILHIERVPEKVSVFVNGRAIGEIAPKTAFAQDITHALTPGDNTLALKVTCASRQGGGVFGDIALQVVVPSPPALT
ncbi:MAG: hypothetical protein OHK0046_31030 [Anaerolineae bacterium]